MEEAQKKLEIYLAKKYNLVQIPSVLRFKLYEAYKSDIHVDPDRLLQLFKLSDQKLNQIRMNNKAKGKEFDGNSLMLYDLAIVLSYYPDYISKIRQHEKQEHEYKDMNDSMKMQKNIANMPRKKNKKKSVSKIVNELFFLDQVERVIPDRRDTI